MTATRRVLVLLALTLAITIGASLPATAAHTAVETLPVTAATTVDVVAPSNPSTAGTRCSTWYDPYGRPHTTLEAELSWEASTTPGVVRHVVNAHVNGTTHPYPVAAVDAPATTARDTHDASVTANDIRVSVTAVTSYGWTEQSARSGLITC
ncbi:hypothetical protein ACI79C_16400 [Geodermatophilus sp. SYSU D00697]